MTPEQKNNAFNGDWNIYLKIAELCKKHSVKLIVETGTFHGKSTVALREICENILTIEVNAGYLKKAIQYFGDCGFRDIVYANTSSPGGIFDMFNLAMDINESRLFFLDAHWEAYNPLIDELKAIADSGSKPVIVIHDFYVPGKSTTVAKSNEWGFDSYDGQDYNWEWIQPQIEAIYGVDGYKISYNDNHEAPRGCIFIEPKL